MRKTLAVCFLRTIDIQMVGVHAGDDGYIGREMMERAIKLICLDHHIIALSIEQEISVIVIGNATKKSVGANMRGMEDMCQNGAGSRFAMRTCHTKSLLLAGNQAQHFRTLEDSEPLLTQPHIQRHILRHSRRTHHHRRCHIQLLHLIQAVIILHNNPLCFKRLRQRRRSTVIAHDTKTLGYEIPCQSTHAYATYTQKVICINRLHLIEQ